jgi:hypothetical protein
MGGQKRKPTAEMSNSANRDVLGELIETHIHGSLNEHLYDLKACLKERINIITNII